MTTQGTILFIDAYDSFAENITALLRQQLDVQVTFIHIDCDVPAQFGQSHEDFFSSFDAIVLGPGPGSPKNDSDVGLFAQVWEYAAKGDIPLLGICLGFQSLCTQYGVSVVRMDLPCHGHAKRVFHTNRDIFAGAGDVVATNYNSLGVREKDLKRDHSSSRPGSSGSMGSLSSSHSLQSTASTSSKPSRDRSRHRLGDGLEVIAWDQDHWVMAVKHRLFPFHGLQFHPESCKSNLECRKILTKWWQEAIAHNNAVSRLTARKPAPSPLHATPSTNSRTESGGYDSLLEKFGRLACSSGSHVTCMTIPMARGAADIAFLCHEMSPSSTVVMLESTKRGRYSLYAFPDSSNFHVEYARQQCSIFQMGRRVDMIQLDRDDVVRALENFCCSKQTYDDEYSIPFRGGFMGFFSYEFGAASLNLDVPPQQGSPPSTPDISLLWVERSIIFDHLTGTAYVQSIKQNDLDWVQEMIQRLGSTDVPSATVSRDSKLRDILSNATFAMPHHDQYISQIQACQSELLAGNSYELCLTTEATITTPSGPDNSWLLYKNIQRHNPVPFAAYLRLNKTTVLSSSPEQFLSWSRDGTIDMVPMKGTVKKTPDMTFEKASAILASAKESAENLMIADLIRHDLYSTVGRDALVEVVKLCDVVETETVFALVSHIRAHVPRGDQLNNDDNSFKQEMTKYGIKALTRTLPPGSMTGAPKKRSCEILHNLEQRDRGVYSGATGYIDVNGNGAWSVCIRIAFSNEDDDNVISTDDNDVHPEYDNNVDSDDVENTHPRKGPVSTQKWRIGAGGAITVLSDPEQEWEEMMTKLDSVLRGFRPD